MKVKDLIAELNKIDPNKDVHVTNTMNNSDVFISNVHDDDTHCRISLEGSHTPSYFDNVELVESVDHLR